MLLPPAAVVFDLDGTLIDSRGDIIASANHALTKTGRPALPAPAIVRHIGDGARTLLARLIQQPETSPEVDPLLALFIEYYTAHPLDFTRWMPGARECLEALGQIDDLVLALCTNKPRQTTDAVLAGLGVRTRFRVTVAGGDLSEKKPAPAPLLHIAKQLELDPAALVMVGDGPQDVECARRAGARSVALEGFVPRDRVQAAGPDVMLRSMREVVEVIKRWRDATIRMGVPTPTK